MEARLIEEKKQNMEAEGFDVVTEYDIIQGYSQYGKGDLLAIKGNLVYAVECKIINKTNATKKRKKVRDQALLYASFAKLRYPSCRVKGVWATNQNWGTTDAVSEERSRQIVKAFLMARYSPHVLDIILRL